MSQSIGVLVSGSSLTISTYHLRDAVESGGTLIVVAGGTADETGILSGGTVIVDSGGSAQSDLVDGGAVIVSAGGFASNTGLTGALTVSAQGTAEGGFIQGGNISIEAGGSGGGFVFHGGNETVSSGAVDSGSTLEIGSLTVLAGGTAINEDVTPNGAVLVQSGGLAVAVMNGNLPGSAIGVTLLSGASMTVSSGGVAMGDLIESGASMTVNSGGVEDGSELLSGGSETVSAGGTAINTLIGVTSPTEPGGTLTVVSGGIASATDFLDGGNIIVGAGGTLINPLNNSSTPGRTTIEAGGVVSVTAGNSAFGFSLDPGGTLDIAAGAEVALAGAIGGSIDVTNGAALGLSFASAGGSILVGSGGSAVILLAGPGGIVTVASGGTLEGGGVAGQGTLDIQQGAFFTSGIAYSGYAAEAILGGTNISGLALYNFGADNTLDLPNIAYDPAGTVGSSGSVLSFTENGTTYDIALSSAGIGGHALTLAADASGGTMIEVACFAAGTRIATPSGEAAVESLRPGDAVLALIDGAWRTAPVRWVGRTTIDPARHPHPERAAPIRIRQDAVAPGLPRRDLLLSPDHALYLDGALIQAQALANGATVAQEFSARVTYHHVELDRHAVLLADGLPAESYLDTGNRALFAGEAGARTLHPDLAAPLAWDERACARLHLTGPVVAQAHARLLLRAVALGHALTADPALEILADGRDLPLTVAGPRWQAMLPAGTRSVHLRSASFVPAWFAEDDRRRLGVAVRRLLIGGRAVPRTAHGAGWHAPEAAWRWTDGDATLSFAPPARPTRLVIELTQRGERYWTAPARQRIPLAAEAAIRA